MYHGFGKPRWTAGPGHVAGATSSSGTRALGCGKEVAVIGSWCTGLVRTAATTGLTVALSGCGDAIGGWSGLPTSVAVQLGEKGLDPCHGCAAESCGEEAHGPTAHGSGGAGRHGPYRSIIASTATGSLRTRSEPRPCSGALQPFNSIGSTDTSLRRDHKASLWTLQDTTERLVAQTCCSPSSTRPGGCT